MIRIQNVEVAPYGGLRHCTCEAYYRTRGVPERFIGRYRKLGGRISKAEWRRIIMRCPLNLVGGVFDPPARSETSKIRGTIDV